MYCGLFIYLFLQVRGLGSHPAKPSWRLEVSPPPTPESPRSRFNHSALYYGTYSHPGPSQSRRAGTLLDHSFASDSFRRYAFSEAPRVTQLHASTAPVERFHQKSLRRTAAPQFANAPFQQSVKYGSRRSCGQTVDGEEKRTAQGQSGEMMLGAVQPNEGLGWLAQVRREGQQLSRMKSYPPTVTSMEVNMGRQLEVEPPIQQIQAQNVMTL